VIIPNAGGDIEQQEFSYLLVGMRRQFGKFLEN
jgi:hypothetical protein